MYLGLDTQTLITLCERALKQPAEEIDTIQFKENYSFSLEDRDINSVVLENNTIIFYLNNLGLLGLQSPTPSYILENLLSMEKNNPIISLINIFNNIIARLIYKSKSSLKLNYMHPSLLYDIKSNAALTFDEYKFCINKTISKYTLHRFLTNLLNDEARIVIHKLSLKAAKINTTLQMHINKRLGRHPLGKYAMLHCRTDIIIHALSRRLYDKLTSSDHIHIMYKAISKFVPNAQYSITIVPNIKIYKTAILNKTRLGVGIKLGV